MFYSARHFWRLAALALITCPALARFPRASLENGAGAPRRRLEWKIRDAGNAIGSVLEGIRRGMRGALR